MTDIISVPTSVRHRLEQARTLLAQNRPEETGAAYRTGGAELAGTYPELAAIVAAASIGQSQISGSIKEVITIIDRVPRTLFGIPLGERRLPNTTTREVFLELKLE